MCTTDLRPISLGKMYHIDPKKIGHRCMLLDQLRDNNNTSKNNNSNNNNNNDNNSKGAIKINKH